MWFYKLLSGDNLILVVFLEKNLEEMIFCGNRSNWWKNWLEFHETNLIFMPCGRKLTEIDYIIKVSIYFKEIK